MDNARVPLDPNRKCARCATPSPWSVKCIACIAYLEGFAAGREYERAMKPPEPAA